MCIIHITYNMYMSYTVYVLHVYIYNVYIHTYTIMCGHTTNVHIFGKLLYPKLKFSLWYAILSTCLTLGASHRSRKEKPGADFCTLWLQWALCSFPFKSVPFIPVGFKYCRCFLLPRLAIYLLVQSHSLPRPQASQFSFAPVTSSRWLLPLPSLPRPLC